MKVKKMLTLITLLLVLVTTFSVSTTVMAAPVFATTAEATAAATNLGYAKTNELVNRQAVYKKGNYYISRDVDGHNGGAWKRAIGSAAKLGSKTTKDGTWLVGAGDNCRYTDKKIFSGISLAKYANNTIVAKRKKKEKEDFAHRGKKEKEDWKVKFQYSLFPSLPPCKKIKMNVYQCRCM